MLFWVITQFCNFHVALNYCILVAAISLASMKHMLDTDISFLRYLNTGRDDLLN